MGNPSAVKPPGTDIPGIPARFAESVKISDRYIARGSSVFSPIFQAAVGVTGEMSTSQDAKAFLKSLRITLFKRISSQLSNILRN